jgi:hypothetical protein
MSARRLLAILALACVTWVAAAQERPRTRVRVHLEPAGTVMPGQSVKLVVDVLTTTWFTAAPVLPTLTVPGALVSPPGDQAANFSEQEGATRWFGISRNYLITPQAGGALAIASFAIIVTPGGGTGAVTLHTPALTVPVREVARPPGAENAIATTQLTLTQHVDRPLSGLRAGDAITRSIKMHIDGVPAMMLSPVQFGPMEGMAVYPMAAQVHDITRDRVGFVAGERVDAASYVIQRAGRYTLPAFSMQWWDTRSGVLRTASVAAITLTAAANPAYRPAVDLPAEASGPAAAPHRRIDVYALARWVGLGLLAAMLLAWALPPMARAAGRLQSTLGARRAAYRASEGALFARLRRARSDTAFIALAYAWTARSIGPRTPLAGLGHRFGVSAFDEAARNLLEAHYACGGAQRPPPLRWLRRTLAKVRRAALANRAVHGTTKGHIPPLNP